MKKLLLSIIVCWLFCSCASTQSSSSVLPNVDFSKYKFAAMKFDTSVGSSVFFLQTELQNSLISCGYDMISDTRIGTLSDEDQLKSFIVTAGTKSSRSLSDLG